MNSEIKELELKIQSRMGRILLWGMLASAAIIIVGAVLYLNQFGSTAEHFTHFTASTQHLKTVGQIARGIREHSGGAIIEAGILLLVLFQYVRVIMSALMFARLRSWFFVGISGFILAVLIYGLFS